MNQATILEPVRLNGTGLHQGRPVHLEFHPADPGQGISFVRTDRDDRPRIAVRPENLTGGVRGTNLREGDVQIHTIEHVLAASWACGLDNLEIRLDAEEPPAGDGSSQLYLKALEKAGRVEQEEARRVMHVNRATTIDDGNATLIALKANAFKVTYTLEYDNPFIGCQIYDAAMDRERFKSELSSARTFCLKEEVDQLHSSGLGLGGSLENAIVIDGNRMLNKDPLRFPDEFVRHKVLDLIGDLSTLGADLKGHFIAMRSGHRHNILLIRKLIEEGALTMSEPSPRSFNFEQIKAILPHRYPFLLIDRITEMEPGQYAKGIKNVTGNEPFFQGHFPLKPVMPGVLIMEALAQAAGVCFLSIPENAGKTPYFTGLDNVHFRRPVEPGDQLRLEVVTQRVKRGIGWVTGKAWVDEKIVAEGTLKFTLR